MVFILALAAVFEQEEGDNEETAWEMACSDIQEQSSAIPTPLTYS